MSNVGLAAKLRRVLTSAAPIEAAHRFMWTRVGTEIELTVGYLDLAALKDVIDAAKLKATPDEVVEIPFYVTHRFSLSPDAAVHLAEVANEIVSNLKEIGMVPKDQEKPSAAH